MYPFEAYASGKWILLGEHAVIRNFSALVFPLHSRRLRLRFNADFETPALGSTTDLAVRKALAGARNYFAEKKRPFILPDGNFAIKSNIPMSAGLGSSAAFCVAIARLFVQEKLVDSAELFELCRRMEDSFHGTSSGMDLAVILRAQPILFHRQSPVQELRLAWTPKIYLCDSGMRSSTAESVAKVQALLAADPARGASIDQKMAGAVAQAMRGLSLPEAQGLPVLREALRQGCECFADWELLPEKVRETMQELEANGAIAVKPTGSGDGGFVLSLWQETPPPALLAKLISGFSTASDGASHLEPAHSS